MDKIIVKKCSEVFNVSEEKIFVIERLMGGMSNLTYIVNVDSIKYVFRIPGKNAFKFVDRSVEIANLELVKSLGVNNKTVYLDKESGIKIALYVEGTPMHELNPLDYLNEVASVLHKIHDSNLVADNNYDPLARLDLYESYMKEYNYKHVTRYFDLKDTLYKYKKQFNSSSCVLCHGDSQVSNFVVDSKTVYLVDWEFAGNNDPFYDIACFGNQDFTIAEKLLPVYLGHEPSILEYNRLYINRAFQCLQWHNVALYKHFIGLSEQLGVDFMMISSLYLDKAEGFFNSVK